MSQRFDHRHVQHAFTRAADTYDAAATLQHEVEARLLETIDEPDFPRPAVVLDLGCGTGRASVSLKKRWRRARVIALDLAPGMLARARRKHRWWRPLDLICGDAAHLPLAEASVDLLFSNLCLQWLDDLPAVLAGFRRVLRPHGRLLLSTFGPATLHELRTAFAAGDHSEHVSPFVPIQQLGDALLAAGFRDPVLDRDLFTLTYPDFASLLRELKAIGATHAATSRRRSLTGRGRFAAARTAYEALRTDGSLPSTWEVLYARAHAPEPGAPVRAGDGEVACFPAARIGIIQR